jgi:hypothetical protein
VSLKNLVGISLEAVVADKSLVGLLIQAAERNVADAQLKGLSVENRFDVAYKAVMQMAMVALNANGYRPLKSKPGHHQTAIQTLVLTVGLPLPTVIVIVLDALRKQRNLADYSGDLVPESAAVECLASALELLDHVRAWLRANRPDLI